MGYRSKPVSTTDFCWVSSKMDNQQSIEVEPVAAGLQYVSMWISVGQLTGFTIKLRCLKSVIIEPSLISHKWLPCQMIIANVHA